MNQLLKTGIFAGAAVVAILLAVVASMERRFGKVGDEASELLFPSFQDPKLAQSMEIVKFDEDTGTRHDFKVGQITDERGRRLWVIQSHNDYPADANTQLAGAASALVDKQRGPRISADRGQHATYGVLDPTEEGKAGEKGMGTLVVFAGEGDKKLAELIVGKPVKDRPTLRYARVRGQDAVYQVEIDATKLSTKFDDWIERDLLKLEASHIKEITIRDLDVVDDRPVTKGLLELKYENNANENRWALAGLQPGEKLDEAKLNDLRTAIDDLKIVDVHKKPEALADLLLGKNERRHTQLDMLKVQASLEKHGFKVYERIGIVPTDGVVNVQMDDGLEYALYFGGIASLTADQSEASRKEGDKKEGDKKENDDKEGEKKDDAKPEGEKKDKKDKAAGSNRYVFVSVQLNEDQVKKPELKPLPGESLLPSEKAVEKSGEAKKEGDAKATKAKPAGKPKKATLADAVKELRRLNDEGLIDQAEWDHQHKEAERANQRAQETYDSNLKAGRKREKELNERFADWYYVIDDQVYKKIRLKRTEIVKAPEKAKDEKAKDEKAKDGKVGDEKSTGEKEKGGAKAGTTKTP